MNNYALLINFSKNVFTDIEIKHWTKMGQKYKNDVGGVILLSLLLSLNVISGLTSNNYLISNS